MSEFDDLEEISTQARYGYNSLERGFAKGSKARVQAARRRGAEANRSVDKQSHRSSDRRGVLARIENQE